MTKHKTQKTKDTRQMTNDKPIWRKVAYKTGVWLAVEIWLNVIGLDNIADYSEFIFAQDLALRLKNRRTVNIMEYPPQFCHQIDDFCPIPVTMPKLIDMEQTSCPIKLGIFRQKCQQLAEPCIKIMCLGTKVELCR